MNARGIRRRVTGENDPGMGLILIIGVSVLVFTLAGAATALAVNSISQSRQRTTYEVSLATAETGIDRVLSDVQTAFSTTSSDYPLPGPTSWCTALSPVDYPTPPVGEPIGSFASEDAEKTWARARLDELVAAGCTKSDGEGEYVVLKPVSANPRYGKVYALAALPSFDEPTRTRLVKVEYVFMPFQPGHAVLAGGDLDLGTSSTDVLEAAGVAAGTAGVHSNGVITANSHPDITGTITSSASTGASFVTTDAPMQMIPPVSARFFYGEAGLKGAPADWYDLCPNGDVRKYSTSGTPCTGEFVGNATTVVQRGGWRWFPLTRTWEATGLIDSGTYYAFQSNVTSSSGGASSNAAIDAITIVAEALNSDNCATKQYGNISWNKYDLRHTHNSSVWFLADTDIVTGSNFMAGSSGFDAPYEVSGGMFIAGDQISMQTSSTGGVGSVIAAGQCASLPSQGIVSTTDNRSEIKNLKIWYDPQSEAPFTSVVTTSLWLDYANG